MNMFLAYQKSRLRLDGKGISSIIITYIMLGVVFTVIKTSHETDMCLIISAYLISLFRSKLMNIKRSFSLA